MFSVNEASRYKIYLRPHFRSNLVRLAHKTVCYFCQKNVDDVDFKNVELLSKFVSGFYKIKPRKKTNLCSYHQKKIATAIKRARQMGLLPYTVK